MFYHNAGESYWSRAVVVAKVCLVVVAEDKKEI